MALRTGSIDINVHSTYYEIMWKEHLNRGQPDEEEMRISICI